MEESEVSEEVAAGLGSEWLINGSLWSANDRSDRLRAKLTPNAEQIMYSRQQNDWLVPA